MPILKRKPKQKPFVSNWTLIALLLAWLLAGCGTPPLQPPSLPVPNVRVPPLPQSARQPSVPPECQPTCSQRLVIDLESWRQRLIDAAQPASSANGSTTPQ